MSRPSMAAQLAALRDELTQLRADVTTPRRALLTEGAASDAEEVDPNPVELPVDEGREDPSLRLVEDLLRKRLEEAFPDDEIDSFEDWNDFEPDDDEDVIELSGFEIHEYQMEDEDLAGPPADLSPEEAMALAGKPPEKASEASESVQEDGSSDPSRSATVRTDTIQDAPGA